MSAKIIEVEGTDGAGKTTALKYLIEKLRASGKTVLETREVGSPLIPVCVKLREIVLAPESNLSGEAMEFIFAAMRLENQKYYATVRDQYDFIVSDRGWLSHLAYTDHNVSGDFTETFYGNVVAPLTELADVILYLDVNTETALKRRVKRGTGMDVIEMKGVEFQEKVRGSFTFHKNMLEDFASDQVRVFDIDANKSVEGVQAEIDDVLKELV